VFRTNSEACSSSARIDAADSKALRADVASAAARELPLLGHRYEVLQMPELHD
jgi:hypothetical protein